MKNMIFPRHKGLFSGNVKVKRDALNVNYTETYGYDDLSRLISANSTSYGNKTFHAAVFRSVSIVFIMK